jgi:hypothetical protein
MKIKTLLLSSVVATGLSTGAMAADLGTLTSLDVCDALGITGLTISSDSNCLQISGGVEYTFTWGDYDLSGAGVIHPLDDDSGATDWASEVEAFLKFVGTASSDFGPAKAVIKLEMGESVEWTDGVITTAFASGVTVDEAYVSVGDSTVLMAGLKGSVANSGGDTAYNWLGLRHDDDVRTFDLATVSTGGHVIQLTSDLGNGVDVALGFEDLAGTGALVGVLNYSGDSVAAHLTVVADDVLTGTISTWAIHAGVEVTYDMFKFLVAAGYDSTSGDYDILASAQATFDMFTLAAAVGASQVGALNGVEAGISATAAVTDTVTVMLGARWDDHDTATANDELWNIDAGIKAEVTETITLTAGIGVQGDVALATQEFYGNVGVAWAPGGGFASSVDLEANQSGAYKVEFNAKKSF